MKRRSFLGTLSVMAGVAKAAPGLAIDGGVPVRSTPLPSDHWGPSSYNEKELARVVSVIREGNPFRWRGRPGHKEPDRTATFEKEFAARMNTSYALAVSSGTAALQSAIAAFEIGPGDEVIMPAWTWHSDCTAVIMAGALPVFAEIDETFNIDPADIEHRITPQTKLIIAVHLQGVQADLDPILAIGKKHGIPILEDSAQCVGGSYHGRPLGSLGAMGIYSHQVNKTISSGEGGSVVTSDPVLYERAARFHDVGSFKPSQEETAGKARLAQIAGLNFRMNEFAGGVMLEQVRKLDTIIGKTRASAAHVRKGIEDLPGIRFRKEPDPAGIIGDSVYIEFDSKDTRDRFVAAMRAENVGARPPGGSAILPIQTYVMKKLTAQRNWPTWNVGRGKTVQYGPETCPRTIDIHNRFAGVSLSPGLSRQDTEDIIAAIRKVHPVIAGS